MTGIKIDLERDKLFDKLGIQRLKESYMKEDEESPQAVSYTHLTLPTT